MVNFTPESTEALRARKNIGEKKALFYLGVLGGKITPSAKQRHPTDEWIRSLSFVQYSLLIVLPFGGEDRQEERKLLPAAVLHRGSFARALFV